jgi:hypothetical protein
MSAEEKFFIEVGRSVKGAEPGQMFGSPASSKGKWPGLAKAALAYVKSVKA